MPEIGCTIRQTPHCKQYFFSKKTRQMTKSAHLKKISRYGKMIFPVDNKNSFYCRYFRIAGVTIRVTADLPICDSTFAAKFKKFEIERPESEQVRLTHHFAIPAIRADHLGREMYRKAPWAIYRKGSSWTYLGIKPGRKIHSVYCLAEFNDAHTLGNIYHQDGSIFSIGKLHSLTLFPTDQIWLARVLAERKGFFLHAAGMKIHGQGLLFAGHSEAGKSTTVSLLQDEGEILCDDRMIVRRWPEGFRIHGTWSHGDVPHVSAADAPLRAILFLEKARTNRMSRIENPKDILQRLLPLLIKPLVTSDWWQKTLAVVGELIHEVPAYRLRFDKSGRIREIVRELATGCAEGKRTRGRRRLP
jgi:hypothetical protein